MPAIETRVLDRELKKGSAELIILSIIESGARQRDTWKSFVSAMDLITGVDHA